MSRDVGGESLRVSWVVGLSAIVVTALIFLPVVTYDFVIWDDDLHVYANPRLQALNWTQVGAFWQAPYAQLYMPLTYTAWAGLTWLSRALVSEPMQPALFHMANLAIHLASVGVVYGIGLMLTERDTSGQRRTVFPAAIGALLFGVHPLQVEAVVWISGLKDLLYGWWALVAVWQYLTYARSPGARQWWVPYGLATAAYGLALLAKPAAVAIPIVAWVLDTGGLGRTWWQATRALGSWLIVAVLWGVWTTGQQPDALMDFITPLWLRPVVAADAVTFYLGKLLWPVELGPDYGRTPQVVLEQGWRYAIPLVLFGLGMGLWRIRRWGWGPTVAAGVFVAALLPVLGLVPFAFQEYSTVADRYVYLAFLGPALGLGWAVQRMSHQRTWWLAGLLLLGVLAWCSAQQVRVWRDTITLFMHALQVNPRSALAHNNLGFVMAQHNQPAEAMRHFYAALTLNPRLPEAQYNMGRVFVLQGKLNEAIVHYDEALRLRPNWAEAHNNLGIALAEQGKLTEALTHYARALLLRPNEVEAYFNLGIVFTQQGRSEEAIGAYRAALRHRPDWPQAAHNLARLLLTRQGSTPESTAETLALAELACHPDSCIDARKLHTLAMAYASAGQAPAAVETAHRALAAATTPGENALAEEIYAWLCRHERAYSTHVGP
jgi:protein O-mannosyl-transferase